MLSENLAGKVNASNEIDTKIVEMVKSMTSAGAYPAGIQGARLERDLGLDSLDLVELLLSLEKEFNLEIPESSLADVNTVQDLINLLKPMVVQTAAQ